MPTIKQTKELAEASEACDNTFSSYRRLVKGGTGYQLKQNWGELVGHWGRSFNFILLCTRGGKSQQLHNKAQTDKKTDEIVKFLFHSRHSKEHVQGISDPTKATLRQFSPSGQESLTISEDKDNDMHIWMEGNVELMPDGRAVPFQDLLGKVSDGKFINGTELLPDPWTDFQLS